MAEYFDEQTGNWADDGAGATAPTNTDAEQEMISTFLEGTGYSDIPSLMADPAAFQSFAQQWDFTPADYASMGASPEQAQQLGGFTSDQIQQAYNAGGPDTQLPNSPLMSNTAPDGVSIGSLGGQPISMAEMMANGATTQDLKDAGFTDAAISSSGAKAGGSTMWDAAKGALTAAGTKAVDAFSKNIIPSLVSTGSNLLQNQQLSKGLTNATNQIKDTQTQNNALIQPYNAAGQTALGKMASTAGNVPTYTNAANATFDPNLNQKQFSYDPNTALQNPFFKAAALAGTQGVDASAAAKGTFGSGNQASALYNQGVNTFGQWQGQDYNQQLGALNTNNASNALQGQYTNTLAQQQYQNQQAAQQAAFANALAANQQAFGQQGTLATLGANAMGTGVNANTAAGNQLANIAAVQGGVNANTTANIGQTVGNALTAPATTPMTNPSQYRAY